jgi:hypothetical protein
MTPGATNIVQIVISPEGQAYIFAKQAEAARDQSLVIKQEVEQLKNDLQPLIDELPQIETILDNIADIIVVGDNINSVVIVANNIAAVNAVEAELTNIGIVASNTVAINTVVANLTAIDTVVTNIAAIQAAPQAAIDAEAAKDASEAARDQSETARNESVAARDLSVAARNESQTARNQSQAFRNEAEGFKNDAEASETNAENFRDQAEGFKNLAESAKTDAETARDAAIAAKNDSEAARDLSIAAKDDAEAAAASLPPLNEGEIIIGDENNERVAEPLSGVSRFSLKNFFDDGVLALNDRGVEDNATFVRKLRFVQGDLDALGSGYSLVMLPSVIKVGKLYSIVPADGSGDFAVARNSTATYVGADGLIKTAAIDEPRIEFNQDGSYKGLLVEPQRTNLVLRSEEFDDAYWTKSNATITANAAISPSGVQNADKLIPDTSTAIHSVSRASQPITGGFYSVFVKADGYDWILLTSHSSSAPATRGAFFNLSNGTIGATASGIIAKIEDYGNGWYRCSISEGNAPSSIWAVIVTNADSVITFTGNGADGVLIWGAQNEQGSTASSYIKTEASTFTRVADVISNDLSALVTGNYSMVLDVEANVGRLKVFEALTGFEVDLTGSGRMVVTVGSEITLHFPDGRTLEFLKPSDFVDLDFVTKLTSNHVKVVATLNRIITQSEINGLTSGNLNSPLLDTGSLTSFFRKYINQNYDFFGKIETSSGTNFQSGWEKNNLTTFPLIDTSSGTNFSFGWFDNNLTSFPLIDTSSGINFTSGWRNNNLTSFPLIDTSNGTNFTSAWFNNNLTSFPLIDTSSGTNFTQTWRDNNLQTWPANMFDTCPATNFTNCWFGNALDQQGVDNILVSINKARVDGFSGSNGTLGIDGGTNATPGAAGQAAADALRADGWIVALNGY